jgi:hypothetical protein
MAAMLRILLCPLLLLALCNWPAAQALDPVALAVRGLMAELDSAQRAEACFALDDSGRTQWSYLPGKRRGLSLRQMSQKTRQRAHELLRAALSTQGYLKVTGIMTLEVVLRELERAAGGDGTTRDPEQYSFAFFGEPAEGKAFAWRMEGHHLVITWTNVPGEPCAVTPHFVGTHPATVPSGIATGLEILGREDEVAITLMQSLDEEERNAALLPGAVPADVLAGPGRDAQSLLSAGLPFTELESEEIALLDQLLHEVAADFETDTAQALLRAWSKVPRSACRFAWCGAMERQAIHYWRIVLGRTILEYDQREAGAGHVHFLWRDLDHDHGGDALQAHLHEHHGAK